MQTRTEIINGQEVTIKVYAPRYRQSNRVTTDAFSRSKAKKWAQQREAKSLKINGPKIEQLFHPKKTGEPADCDPN